MPGKRRGRKGPSNNSRAQGTFGGSVVKAGFSVVNRPLFGYTARRTLQYYSPGTITSGASTVGAYVFAANGLFDPDITGTGGQPMGFDQMMLYFNHYTVLRGRARAVFKTNSTTLRATVGLLVSGSSSVTSSIEATVENGDITFQELEFAGAFGGTCTLTRSISMGAFQGLRNTIDDPDMRGDVSTNPAELVYYHLVCWNSSSATVLTCDFQVLLEFDVHFHEPKKATIS